MKLAVCLKCKPPVVIAAGPLPDKVKVKGPKGKPVTIDAPYRHSVKGEVHQAKLVDAPETPLSFKEDPGDYLKRLAKTHKGLLK